MPNEFACFFEGCGKSYTTVSGLKTHLIKRKAQADELHPANDTAKWDLAQSRGLLSSFTRPGNLTAEQRKARRKDTNKRNYVRHKDKYMARARTARVRGREALDAAFELQRLYQAKADRSAGSTVLNDLFESPVDINQWIDMDTMPPDEHVFPQFVTFFFPPNTWPEVDPSAEYDDENPAPLLLECLPSKRTYYELCKLVHPDSANQRDAIDPAVMQRLTAGWQVWEPIVCNEEFSQLRLWREGEDDQFDGALEEVAKFYWAWMTVVSDAKRKLLPTKLTGYRLHMAFRARPAEATPPSDADGGEPDHETMLLDTLKRAQEASPRRRRRIEVPDTAAQSAASTSDGAPDGGAPNEQEMTSRRPRPQPVPSTANGDGTTANPDGGRYNLRR